MKPEWANQKDDPKTLNLPEDSADIVTDYVKWLYLREIPIVPHIANGLAHKKRSDEAEQFFVQMTRAYIFGERIMDVKYKNAMFKAIFTAQIKFNLCMGTQSVTIVYEGTPSGSPLRRLIAADVAHHAYDDSKEGLGWMKNLESYSGEALLDALQATVRVRPKINSSYPGVESYLEKEE